jgi:Fur family iron response transcriptional regulator
MRNLKRFNSDQEVVSFLEAHDVQVTPQRLAITRVLCNEAAHMSAEDVFRLVNSSGNHVSKATVYNTLGLLAEKGVIREVIADPTKIFYDPNIEPHHHIYDVTTGHLEDVDCSEISVSGLPPLPAGTSVERVDIVVRVRPVTRNVTN